MTTYEKCCAIRHAIMTLVAEGHCYTSWSDDYKLKNIYEFFTKTIKRWGEQEDMSIDVSDLTEVEMKNLHFGKWAVDSEGYLIPIWLLPFLQDDIKTSCIDGSATISKSGMDNDHRGGYLAYSVTPREAV